LGGKVLRSTLSDETDRALQQGLSADGPRPQRRGGRGTRPGQPPAPGDVVSAPGSPAPRLARP
jgi:hypothetical protein